MYAGAISLPFRRGAGVAPSDGPYAFFQHPGFRHACFERSSFEPYNLKHYRKYAASQFTAE